MPFRHVPGMPVAYARMIEELQSSVNNFERLYAMQQRNMMTLVESNKISLEVMRAFANRQTQIMEQTTVMFTDVASELLQARNPTLLAQRQLTVAHDAFRLAQSELKAFMQLALEARKDAWQLWTSAAPQQAQEPQDEDSATSADPASADPASADPVVLANPAPSNPAPSNPAPGSAKARRPTAKGRSKEPSSV